MYDKEGHWYNYDTGSMDYRTMPTTDEEAVKYLPGTPTPAARSLYLLYREMGDSIPDALIKVLCAVVGEKP